MGRAWWVLDAAAVVVFVVIGRSSHHHGLALAGVVSTTWPFALGAALGWALLVWGAQRGDSVRAGVVVWLSTVIVGMVARALAGQGTAVAFIAVALGFLGAVMLLPRVAAGVRRRRRGSAGLVQRA